MGPGESRLHREIKCEIRKSQRSAVYMHNTGGVGVRSVHAHRPSHAFSHSNRYSRPLQKGARWLSGRRSARMKMVKPPQCPYVRSSMHAHIYPHVASKTNNDC